MSDVNYSMLPEHMRAGAKAYIEEGIAGGSFLMCVMCNDFARAFYCADTTNSKNLDSWAKWLLEGGIPSDCWGSIEAVQGWITHDGLKGN